MAQSPWSLQLQASTLRGLMNVGMALHKLPYPRPPAPAFVRRIPVTISPRPGEIELYFYTPPNYVLPSRPHARRPAASRAQSTTASQKSGSQSTSSSSSQQQQQPPAPERGYPLLVNFHGGGFTLGHATDDARFLAAATASTHCVAVSVNYRLAPEHPFPTAVEDGVDALLYLVAHAAELGIDRTRIAVSGFSAGGNMAFTVPLRLHAEVVERSRVASGAGGEAVVLRPGLREGWKWTGRLVGAIAFYPSTDYATASRAERRLTNLRPDKEMPAFFTALFDDSYLPPTAAAGASLRRENPYLSPALAPGALLRDGLPAEVFVVTCEFDELRAEGERFARRLREEVGKRVRVRMVPGVVHAWDKGTNPLWVEGSVGEVYGEVCEVLGGMFGNDGKGEEQGGEKREGEEGEGKEGGGSGSGAADSAGGVNSGQ